MSKVQISTEGLSILVGMPTTRDLPVQTTQSLLATQLQCQSLGINFAVCFIVGSAIITSARDRVVHEFMQTDFSTLFWVDSDIAWNADDFIRLALLSKEHGVVSGAYPAKIDGQQTFFLKYDEEKGIKQGDHGLLSIQGIGLGFMAVQRDVIEELVQQSPVYFDEIQKEKRASVFRTDMHNNAFRGEDVAFCADIIGNKHNVWLDPSVTLMHIGTKGYTGSIEHALKELIEQ